MFIDHFIHEVIRTPNDTPILLDVADTFDCGWEGAYAIFDEEAFRDWWLDNMDADCGSYTFEDIANYGEEAEAFYGWTVVSNHHRTPEAAEKKLRKYIARL